MWPFSFKPYHKVVNRDITIYLNIVGDSDCTLGTPIDNALASLAADWLPIAATNNLGLTFALGPDTTRPNLIPTGMNVMMVNSPPSDVRFFNFKIGRGHDADKETRSAAISYVKYKEGEGYIYQVIGNVPLLGDAISHELGHVLGLVDRYYEAVLWLRQYAIDMTCKEIREGKWIITDNNNNEIDRRTGVRDTDNSTKHLPRLAVRAPLPIRIQGEPSINNLMSNNDRSLSQVQVTHILARTEEPTYRGKNWVVILGEWKFYSAELSNNAQWVPSGAPQRATATQLGWLTTVASDLVTGTSSLMPADHVNSPDWWRYPSRPPTVPEKGKGVVFGPPDHSSLHRYPCVRAGGKARDAGNDVQDPVRIGVALGKKWLVRPDGSKSINPLYITEPHWMCYVRHVINDLL
jgi:hypothetical protein